MRARWRERVPTGALRAALEAWGLARVLLGAAYAAAVLAADSLRGEAERPIQIGQGLFAWDGAWYRDLAAAGYDALDDEALRFFPLFPLLGRVLGWVLLGNEGLALVLIANVSAVAAAVLLHRLVIRETADEGAARRAAWLLALAPPAFVLVLGYAEALYLVLAIACFTTLRRGEWVASAGLGFLAALCRPVGAALALAAAVEAGRGAPALWRGRRRGALVERAVAVVAPLAGLGLYVAWVGSLAPFDEQAALRGDITEPFSRLVRALLDVPDGAAGDGLHGLAALVAIGLVVVCARRLPASYTVFAATLLAIALAADHLGSFERYALNAFPLVMAAGLATSARTSALVAVSASSAGFALLALLAFLGAYVP